ncbi:MAG: hypothetical protein V4719_29475 [Planctomycetota bacterium]
MLKDFGFAHHTSRWVRAWMAVVIVLALPVQVFSCLWDYDTLQQERSRFPSTLELVTGKFWRHSAEFYEWRIQDRLERLKSDPKNLDFLDDLAVAYQKTGLHGKAVQVMLDKDKLKPGEYKTYANLGTFYILGGDFNQGLPYIDKALAIDPNAHFGREKYQKWLVEYAQLRIKDGKLEFPLRRERQNATDSDPIEYPVFGDYVLKYEGNKQDLTPGQLKSAIKGVQGMMRFADHDNPLLLEALGDLLLAANNSVNARQLAARCYLQASYVVSDKTAAQSYRDYAELALCLQLRKGVEGDVQTLANLEAEFQKELAQAKKWYAVLKQKELAMIKNGRGVETQFDRLSARDPSAIGVAP